MSQLEVPFWSFDLKQDYRHLIHEYDDLLVLPWSELKFNPLKPPEDVPLLRWAQVFAEIFGHATALLSGSKNYLLKHVVKLYKLYDLFNDRSPPYPSLHELELLIWDENINYVRKTSNYRDTVLNRLDAMNLVAGTVFDCSHGPALNTLLDRNIVFEFDGLSRDLQNFLMEILFASVYEYRLAQNQRDTGLEHVFFLDEGKQVFSVYKERQDAAGIPEIDQLTAKMREFGEGLVVADQEASKLTDSIKANTDTKVLLPTGDQKQFRAIADSMSLSDRQQAFAQRLEVGKAIVQVGNKDPVPVHLRNYSVQKTISDQELEEHQREAWQQLSHEPREIAPRLDYMLSGGRTGDRTRSESSDDHGDEGVSRDADRLLKDVVEHPFKPLLDRYQQFPSRYKGNKLKNELVDHGLVIERKVKGGDQRKLLELTQHGREYVEDNLDFNPRFEGRGGIVHRYWQHRIKERFEEAGWTADLEGDDADVYVSMGNTDLAVEVAMGNKPRELEHVETHLENDIAVWIVCRTEIVKKGLRQRIAERDIQSEQITLHLFQDFSETKTLPE
ncbi:hypothetical protein [Salinilacihabitans rarus]|uniref:hypothetical protein n=1 Tax=Salinilacihabitans rarus TaxID=2961596 RepID=UPI0020C89989|nr:hypothetical protein [Salinilacihabitans rarus]